MIPLFEGIIIGVGIVVGVALVNCTAGVCALLINVLFSSKKK
jgi:hypothetical protein